MHTLKSQNVLAFAITTAGMLHAAPLLAWKVDVHVWVAAQVLEDARDGEVSILLGEESVDLSLPTKYGRALREHPRSFLLGALGPDAFPDVAAGQLVIHPSFPGGWGTADWLRHLLEAPNLSNEELAFVLGYHTHAASDIFAHSFVNRYAGDVFELGEHPTAAIRHIWVESFVSRHMPTITTDTLGSDIHASDFLRVDGDVEIPERLLLDRFFLNDEAEDQFSRSPAPHLALAKQLYDNLGDALSENGLVADFETTIADIGIEYLAGLPIDDSVAAELTRIHREINEELNELSSDARGVLLKLNTELSNLEGLGTDLTEDVLIEATETSLEITSKLLDLARADEELEDAALEVARLEQLGLQFVSKQVEEVICKNLPWPLDDLCSSITRTVTEISPLYVQAKLLRDAKRDLFDELQEEVDNLRERLPQAIREGIDVIRQEQELRRQARAIVIDIALDRPFGNQFRNHLERWREGIPVALVEYSRANAAAIINSIDPAKPSLTEPLADWLVCYGPVFVSVSVRVTEGACYLYDGITELRRQLDEFEQALADSVPLAGEALRLKRELEAEIEELKNEVLSQLTIEGLEEFQSLTGQPVADLYKALTEEPTNERVDAVFASDPSGQMLPSIPDASTRLLAEMGAEDGQFDPDEFNALYNSVVLSKLALLQVDELQGLAEAAGVTSSVYGSELYSSGSRYTENILYGFARSIDGNHQWQVLGPPHPRMDNEDGYDEADFELRAEDPDNYDYGYRDVGCVREAGMRLWVDPTAREAVFRRIFHGPLVAGVDRPDELSGGFGEVLPPNYPELFPEGDDWGLDAITLVPSADVSFGLRGTGVPGAKLDVSVSGVSVGSYAYDENGSVDVVFDVPATALPAWVEVSQPDIERDPLLRFSAGCDGAEVVPGQPLGTSIVVRRGNTLWGFSDRLVGSGLRYPELFEANATLIRDPDLIFPGQVFQSPWPPAIVVERLAR